MCVSKTIGEVLKTYRAYLKYFPKWKYYDLSLKKQRELIIQKGIGLSENEIEEKRQLRLMFMHISTNNSFNFIVGSILEKHEFKL